MDSFQNPVGQGPRDPYERYRIEPVEPDKGGRPPGGGPPKEKWGIAAYLLLALKKIVAFFESTKGGVSLSQDILNDLLELKKFFDLLKKEDRSEDVQFLNQLSNVWLRLLEDGIRFHELKPLVKSIQNYPKNQTHTLGYYLSEYAGQKWIPFPYMELVAKLHSDYESYPQESPLVEWTQMIDDLRGRFGSTQ